MTTITQVAQRAGVGVATVSRVLNRSPRVSEPTRVRVLEAIDELGYAPNAAARALSTGRTRTVGVVAPFFTQPSVVERLRAVSRVLAEAGYQLVLFDVEGPVRFVELAAGGRLDGLLCVSVHPTADELDRFEAAGVRVTVIDTELPGVPGVFIDDVEGGRLAAEHLLSLGHRRIGFIADREPHPFGFTSSARRRIGATEAIEAAGAQLVLRRGPHDRDKARTIAHSMLTGEDAPTAIFAPSDLQALGVLEAAEDLGLDVPGDLSVVGFDDIEVARYAGLTTVAQPLEESGKRGAEMLIGALAGAPVDAERLELRLVVRRTTAPPRESARQTTTLWHQSISEEIGQRGATCQDV
jgi:LacI family transcriptional regulator, galactose operon repressor